MTRIPRGATPTYTTKRWTLGTTPWQALPTPGGAWARVLIDNDFSGDPDDLYQLVHHLLSPSVDIRAVIGSRLREGDGFDPGPDSATHATAIVHDVFARMGLDAPGVVAQGSNRPLADRTTPQPSAALDAIVAEALRDDDSPLFYVAGAGLTDLASAVLTEPSIAERMTVVWIGGNEHPGLASPPPDAMPIEYNLFIDVTAGQVVFNDSQLPIWQVPRNVYRQCLVSDAELRRRVATTGDLGRYLYEETITVTQSIADHKLGAAETYALGDSPLVLLTALQSLFEPDSSSSHHQVLPTPAIESDGSYSARPEARPMRLFTWVDTRLMFEDMFLKLEEFDAWLSTP